MTEPCPARSGPPPKARVIIACATLIFASPITGPRLAAESATPAPAPTPTGGAPAAPKRNIAGPGDYALREKIVHLIGRDPDLAQEAFTIVMVNGGAVYSGPIKTCALERRALMIAATLRGVVNVTDEMIVPRGDAPDDALAKAVTSRLSDAASSLELKDLDVQVSDGVLTLQGTVKDIASRMRAEEIAGAVLGITRISNRLRSADAPSGADDASIQKAVLEYLESFRTFDLPGDITVKVEHGVVTLKGRVSLCLGRQQAALAVSQVKGVAGVDNRLRVDPSIMPRQAQIQAEK